MLKQVQHDNPMVYHPARGKDAETIPKFRDSMTKTLTFARTNLKPQTSNLKPQTSNLKPQTSNLKPQTLLHGLIFV
jgi:hypothetical protein